MLLVIMTRSLIRLDNTVRASLNNDCMTNRHDGYEDITKGYNAGTRAKADVRTNVDDDGITKGYNDGITKGYNE